MAIFQLKSNSNWFPPEEYWGEDEGIVAIGGDLKPDRLIAAYRLGIFPWNEPQSEILWWNPLERMILRPFEVKISKSSRNLLNQKRFDVTFNKAFSAVIEHCQKIERPGQEGTWITEEHLESFLELHRRGLAFSVEAWQEGQLVGGLYGMVSGSCFSGESMFSKKSNAGKICFIELCRRLDYWGIPIIDCQIYNPYLASLGAYRVSRDRFMEYLDQCIEEHPDWEEIFSNEQF